MSNAFKFTKLFCVQVCVLLLAHPVLDLNDLPSKSSPRQAAAYSLPGRPLSDRVVLIVLDSWAVRNMESPRRMPRLFGRLPQGAFGVLWAPKVTETAKGVIALSTGLEPFGLDQQRLVFSHPQREWSIFDDVVARGQRVMFAGGPLWVAMFGSRGTGNGPENGTGPDYRGDDLQGLARLQAALQSPFPPTLSVLHISETDFAAHQNGTTNAAYGRVLGFWDDTLDRFLNVALVPGTTVIITSDHGNNLLGDHGGAGDIYRRVPVLMWGAGIAPGARFEMHSVDMPATIAVLLGIRAPSNAVALPAVEALQIPPSERYRILLAAYTQAVLNSPRVTSNAMLMARAQAPLRPGTTDASPASAGPDTGVVLAGSLTLPVAQAAASPEEAIAAESGIARLRASFDKLQPEIVPQRNWRPSDWLFVLIAILSAAGLLVVSGAAVTPFGRSWFSASRALVAAVFLTTEALLLIRFTQSSAVKSALADHNAGVIAAVGTLLIAIALLGFEAWHHRDALLRWTEAHWVTVTLLAWLLISAARPLSAIGFVGLVTTLAVLEAGKWTARGRLAIGLGFAAYFFLGSLYLWPHIGERVAARYLVGAPMALAGATLLFWAKKRRTGSHDFFAWAMLAVLAVFPAGSLGFTGWSDANPVALTSLMTVAFCYLLSRVKAMPVWMALAPASVLAFLWFPRSTVFYAAFALCAGLCTATFLRSKNSDPFRMGAFVSAVCLLLMLSPPSKCLTLIVYFAALTAFLAGKPQTPGHDRSILLTALMLVGMLYATVDLFTGLYDGMMLLNMGSIDLKSAYVGDPARAIVPAFLMVSFKVWLLFFALLIPVGLFEHLRRRFTAIAGMAGALLLLNVAQLSLLTAMSVHGRTQLYDSMMMSLMLTSAMFVFGASAAGIVAWSLPRGLRASSRHNLELANTAENMEQAAHSPAATAARNFVHEQSLAR